MIVDVDLKGAMHDYDQPRSLDVDGVALVTEHVALVTDQPINQDSETLY